MLMETPIDIIRVAGGTNHPPFRGYRLFLADKVALLIASIIAAAVLFFWLLGIAALWGRPQFRFDHAMIVWMIEAELMIVLPTWLLLRIANIAARLTNRWWNAS
jgi:hypothetical protein